MPAIYGIALNGLDEEASKIGAAGLVMAMVEGALMPKLQGIIINAGGNGVSDLQITGVAEVNFSFVLPLLCFIYIAWYGNRVYRTYELATPLGIPGRGGKFAGQFLLFLHFGLSAAIVET